MVFNQMVEQGGDGCDLGPALAGVLGAGRPHPARHRGPAGRRRRQPHPARRAVRRDGAGGLQAPQGARGRGAGQPQPRRPAAAVPPRGGGLRPDDEVDRALPAAGRGALPASRRSARRGSGRAPMGDSRTTSSHRTRQEKHHERHHQAPRNRRSRPTRRCRRSRSRASSTRPSRWSSGRTSRRTSSQQWLGPRDHTMRIDHWDCRTGGSWRYCTADDAISFYGSFHEVRPTSASCRPSPSTALPTASAWRP